MSGTPAVDPHLLERRRALREQRRGRQARVIELREMEPRELLRTARAEAARIAADRAESAPGRTPDGLVADAILEATTGATALGTLYASLEMQLQLDAAKVCRHLSRMGVCVSRSGETQRSSVLLRCAGQSCFGDTRFAFDAASEVALEEFAKGIRMAGDGDVRPSWTLHQQDVRSRRNRQRRARAVPPTVPIDGIQPAHFAEDGARWGVVARGLESPDSPLHGRLRVEVVRWIQHVYDDASDNSTCPAIVAPVDVARLARRWEIDPVEADAIAREIVRLVRESDRAGGVRTSLEESFQECWRLSRMSREEMYGIAPRPRDEGAASHQDAEAQAEAMHVRQGRVTDLHDPSAVDVRWIRAVAAVGAWILATRGTPIGYREAIQLAHEREVLERVREWDVTTHGGVGKFAVDIEHVTRRGW